MEFGRDTFIWSAQTQLRMPDHPGRALLASHSMLEALQRLVDQGASIFSGPDGVSHITTDAPELRCATSGSMGQPKIIRRRPASWQKSFEVNARLFDLGPSDHFAIFGSLGHSLALYGALEAAHLGADISTLYGVRPDKQAGLLNALAATVLYITPTQMGMLLAAGTSFPLVRHVMIGGGKLPDAMRDKAKGLLQNARIVEFYGASETSFITLTDTNTPKGSVGRAYPDVEIMVDDRDKEIRVKSPYLFEGYATDDSPNIRDGFIAVGEIGHVDDQGYVFLRGRKGRMVTIADQNVHPEVAEAVLKAHAHSDKIAVLAVWDEKRGHVLEAVFCASLAASDCDAALRHCRRELGPIKSPRCFQRMPEFAMLEAGKPDLARLQEWLKDQA